MVNAGIELLQSRDRYSASSQGNLSIGFIAGQRPYDSL